MNLSPMGFQYRYDPNGTPGQLLARKLPSDNEWGVGGRDFSIQTMTPDELHFVARVIDDTLNPVTVIPSTFREGTPGGNWPPGPWVA